MTDNGACYRSKVFAAVLKLTYYVSLSNAAVCFEGEATDRVPPPLPLGRMGRNSRSLLKRPSRRLPWTLTCTTAWRR